MGAYSCGFALKDSSYFPCAPPSPPAPGRGHRALAPRSLQCDLQNLRPRILSSDATKSTTHTHRHHHYPLAHAFCDICSLPDCVTAAAVNIFACLCVFPPCLPQTWSGRDSILKHPHYRYQHVHTDMERRCCACNRSNSTKVVAFMSGAEYDPRRVRKRRPPPPSLVLYFLRKKLEEICL